MYELYMVNLINFQVNDDSLTRTVKTASCYTNPLNTTDVHLKPSHVYKAMAYFGFDHLSIWLTWV